jgi:hypothetical protein
VEFVIKTKLASASNNLRGHLWEKVRLIIDLVSNNHLRIFQSILIPPLQTVKLSLLRQHLDKGHLTVNEHLVSGKKVKIKMLPPPKEGRCLHVLMTCRKV